MGVWVCVIVVHDRGVDDESEIGSGAVTMDFKGLVELFSVGWNSKFRSGSRVRSSG